MYFDIQWDVIICTKVLHTVYPKKYAHGFCFTVLCCGYTLTDFPISIRLTSLALWQSNDYPSASKATLMNMDKYFMWINYERLHNHNKAKHNKTVCIFLGIYCTHILMKWCNFSYTFWLILVDTKGMNWWMVVGTSTHHDTLRGVCWEQHQAVKKSKSNTMFSFVGMLFEKVYPEKYDYFFVIAFLS